MNQLKNIPERKPDELFATYVDRLAFANGFKSTQEMIKEVFEEKGSLKSLYFNRNARSLYRNETLYPKIMKLLGKDYDFEAFKDSMFYPSIVPFLKPGAQTSIINSLFSQEIKNRKNLIFNYVAFLNELKFCPECMDEEIQEVGFHIYHKSHQFPGVHVCLKHACLLRRLNSVMCNEYDNPINNSTECERNGSHQVMIEYAEAVHQFTKSFPPSNSDINIEINDNEIKKLSGKSLSSIKKQLIHDLRNSKYKDLLNEESEYIFNYSRTFSRDTLSSMMAGILYIHHSIDNYLSRLPFYDKNQQLSIIENLGFKTIGDYHPALALFECQKCQTKFIGTYQGLCDGFECPSCQSHLSEDELAHYIVEKCSKGKYQLIKPFSTMYNHAHLYNPHEDRHVTCPLYYFIYFDGRDLTRKYTDEDCRRAIEKTKHFEFVRRLNGHKFEVRHKGCGGTFTIKNMKRFTEENTYCHVCGAGRKKRTNYKRGDKNI
ncbi:TniQ family protein [Anaerorhabdus sp.]|uniref:TniQ family protein n=1 Tax=Anaerorhabdus sp. TaxID=1872524 RepID=UPI002FC76447